MVNTYTSGWRSISDGETTTETPRDLVNEQNIAISNAEIQWEGITESEDTTETETNVNTGSVKATAKTRTNSDTGPTIVTDIAFGGITVVFGPVGGDSSTTEGYFPTISDDDKTIIEYRYEVEVTTDGEDREVTYEDINGNKQTTTVNSDFGEVIYSKTVSADNYNLQGEKRELTVYAECDANLTQNIIYEEPKKKVTADFPENLGDETVKKWVVEEKKNGSVVNTISYGVNDGKGGNTYTYSYSDSSDDHSLVITLYYDEYDVESVAFPPVPSGYTFDQHYFRKEQNGEHQSSSFIDTNKVGDEKVIASFYADNTVTLRLETRGKNEIDYTRKTTDPSVSGGDVSGSYTGTLNDGETSTWQPLLGLSPSDNLFTHSVSDSSQARYRIRFEWEYAIPHELAVQRIAANGTTYEVTLADPSDDALFYNSIQTYVSGIGYLAYDVVDTDHPQAHPIEIHHPDHGTLRFRQRQ